jgi:hypothetical protein
VLAQSLSPKQATQAPVIVLQTGFPGVRVALHAFSMLLASHPTHSLFTHRGLAVGHCMSATQVTHAPVVTLHTLGLGQGAAWLHGTHF